MPDPDTARKAVGAAAPVITSAGAAAAPAQSLADRFPPTVPQVDQFTGLGGSYVMDPATGVRSRVVELELQPEALAADQSADA
jgi:hypothetical protein